MSDCKHCGMDTNIRNPSGYCDHLQYPEYCSVCAPAQKTPCKDCVASSSRIAELERINNRLICPHGDSTCPCKDGLVCHYEGDDPMTPPMEFMRTRIAELEAELARAREALKEVKDAINHIGIDAWSDAPYLMGRINAALSGEKP